jgi:protein translocase SecG subunit
MLYEIFVTLFCFFCLLLIIIVVMQKNHGGFWSGPASNDSTIIFGGSGGTDVLQKITWFFGVILILGAFSLSIYKARRAQQSKFTSENKVVIDKKSNDLKDFSENKNVINSEKLESNKLVESAPKSENKNVISLENIESNKLVESAPKKKS